MKKTLKAASVLTWFNLIFWGFITLCLLLAATAMGLVGLVGAVLLSAIPLNCYAALQLHKSIRRPEIKLNHQTPVGIRFIGFVALFFGLTTVMEELRNLQNPGKMLEVMKQSFSGMKGLETLTVDMVRTISAVGLILGLAVVVNVILNFRLLRWYYLVHQSDAS
jgi:hypothetical protein